MQGNHNYFSNETKVWSYSQSCIYLLHLKYTQSMRQIIIFLFFLISEAILVPSFSAEGYMFRVYLKDKGETSFQTNRPEDFLSKRAIERRKRQGIAIDESDFPISLKYIQDIEKLGYTVVAQSKWLSTVSVLCEDSISIDQIKKLEFVDKVSFVWKNTPQKTTTKNKGREPLLKTTKSLEKSHTEYGYAHDQVRTTNAAFLHEQGYTGKGIEIAVIDAGYKNLNEILLLDNINIKGIKNFVYDGEDILQSSDHGLKVLSVMATNRPEIFVGTAPEAGYWLLKTEDTRSEYPIEEDYWVAAAEYADSVGVDIINTSLGYYQFNDPSQDYTHSQLDGKTAHISKGAEMATQKGIFVEVSAGNEGHKSWRKIIVPADVESVLTVGAMSADSTLSYFSSRGPTSDGRIKPDVIALGQRINVVASNGEVEPSDGTSFAGPVMSGLVACLWQAYPDLTNLELLDIIKKSSHKYNTPDTSWGYGIPNMQKAFLLAKKETSGINDDFESEESIFEVYPIDSVGNFRVINTNTNKPYRLLVSSLNGKVILTDKSNQDIKDYYIPNASGQVFIISISAQNSSISKKIKF